MTNRAPMLRPAELEIARHAPPAGCTTAEALAYTRRLATGHYENFNVVSWFLPRALRQHFYNVYAYCRWADDLGDEIPDAARALQLMDWWEHELDACYDGRPAHPVFVALRETIAACDIPKQPFADLLKAFRQDQTVKRYANWEEVLAYCRYSANPVGRLILYLCGYRDEARQRLSDATCTALQLANFWQDVSRDLEKGRIYIPLDRAAAHGLSEAGIVARSFDQRYVALMKELLVRTRELFAEGFPLARQVNGRLSVDLEMFSRGGMAVLGAIESLGYDTLHRRPEISRLRQASLLGRTIAARLFRQQPPAAAPDSVAASYAECHRVARAAHSNFYYAFYLLPRPRRDGLAALYAFMRLVDDAADESGDLIAKQRGLARWRALLDAALSGENPAAHPVLSALADTMRRFSIPPRYLHDLISGAEMDLRIERYPTFERLREYCYRVAGTVGLTCTHVFGFRDSRAVDLSETLGLAFQLTNIIRDVHEDYAVGRVYLPEEDLARFAVAPSDFGRGEATPAMRELLRFETARAWEFYEQGAGLLPLVEPESRGALWLLARTYSALLARIEASDFAVFGERVRLPKSSKIYFAAMAKFGRLTEENVLEKHHRDRRRPGGSGGQRRSG